VLTSGTGPAEEIVAGVGSAAAVSPASLGAETEASPVYGVSVEAH